MTEEIVQKYGQRAKTGTLSDIRYYLARVEPWQTACMTELEASG